jgi:hypothetical protein
MSNPEIIFITISLILLASVAYWIKVPKAILPLCITYLLFILLTSPSKDSLSELPITNSNTINKQKADNIFDTNKDLLKSPIKPTPLTFDSGRTTKKVLKNNTNKQPAYTGDQSKLNIIQNTNANLLRLKDIQICKNVVKRTPEGTDVFFKKDVDSLFCYTRIQNQGKKQEVKHIWYYEGEQMTQIRYNIKKSNIYRSWTRKTILPHQIGKWRVDVQASSGKIIGSKEFQIVK